MWRASSEIICNILEETSEQNGSNTSMATQILQLAQIHLGKWFKFSSRENEIGMEYLENCRSGLHGRE